MWSYAFDTKKIKGKKMVEVELEIAQHLDKVFANRHKELIELERVEIRRESIVPPVEEWGDNDLKIPRNISSDDAGEALHVVVDDPRFVYGALIYFEYYDPLKREDVASALREALAPWLVPGRYSRDRSADPR